MSDCIFKELEYAHIKSLISAGGWAVAVDACADETLLDGGGLCDISLLGLKNGRLVHGGLWYFNSFLNTGGVSGSYAVMCGSEVIGINLNGLYRRPGEGGDFHSRVVIETLFDWFGINDVGNLLMLRHDVHNIIGADEITFCINSDKPFFRTMPVLSWCAFPVTGNSGVAAVKKRFAVGEVYPRACGHQPLSLYRDGRVVIHDVASRSSLETYVAAVNNQ